MGWKKTLAKVSKAVSKPVASALKPVVGAKTAEKWSPWVTAGLATGLTGGLGGLGFTGLVGGGAALGAGVGAAAVASDVNGVLDKGTQAVGNWFSGLGGGAGGDGMGGIPQVPSLWQDYRDSIEAMRTLYPYELALRGEMLPAYQNQELAMQKQYAPQFAQLDYELAAKMAPQYFELNKGMLEKSPAYQAAYSGVMADYNAARAGQYAPEIQQQMVENLRASQSLRGTALSPYSSYQETMARGGLIEQQKQQALSNLMPFIQYQNAGMQMASPSSYQPLTGQNPQSPMDYAMGLPMDQSGQMNAANALQYKIASDAAKAQKSAAKYGMWGNIIGGGIGAVGSIGGSLIGAYAGK